MPANTSSDIAASTAKLWSRRRRTYESIASLLRAEMVRESEFVGARRVGERLFHRPGRDLVVQGDDGVVAHRKPHRLAREAAAPLLVDARKSALEQLIDAGIGIARPAERAGAGFRIGGGQPTRASEGPRATSRT